MQFKGTVLNMFARGVNLTLSAIVASQSGWASRILTISVCPCSHAHIMAVEPSLSWAFTLAPTSNNICTISFLPWLTANMSAVCPSYQNRVMTVWWVIATTNLTRLRTSLISNKEPVYNDELSPYQTCWVKYTCIFSCFKKNIEIFEMITLFPWFW